MDWPWGIQLLLACGLLFVLVGVLWPKLKSDESMREKGEVAPPLRATVLPMKPSQARYADQVHRAYRRLFNRWLKTPPRTELHTDDDEINRQRAA